MSGSKVLEGFGRMLVLAVGPNSQQVWTGTVVLTHAGRVKQHHGAHTGVSHWSALLLHVGHARLQIPPPLTTPGVAC